MNTKNIAFLGLGLFAAVALASCDNIEDSLAKPITNPQQPIFNVGSVEFIAYPSIDASDPTAGPARVGYCSAELPEGFSVAGTIQLSPYADFSKEVIESPLTSEGKTLYANTAELAAQYTDSISLDPSPVTLHARTILTAVNGTEEVRIGDSDTFFGITDYTFVPASAENVISAEYYLIPGDGENWNYVEAVKFNHSDVNQYDDPNFKILRTDTFKVGARWMIMPSTDYAKAFNGTPLSQLQCLVASSATTTDGVTSGNLAKVTDGSINTDSVPALVMPCQVEFNAKSLTYNTQVAVEAYYATGNGWSNWGAHWMRMSTSDFVNYIGFLNVDSEFKFAPQQGWGGDFGAANALVGSESDGAYTYVGKIKDSGDNIKIGTPGLYFAQFDILNWDLTMQQVKSWGIIGGFSSNNWGSDVVVMTPSADLFTWTADITVDAGTEWKFRANGAWTINLGGTDKNLTKDGANIKLPAAGTYTVTLDLTTYPATFKALKK